MPARKAVQPVLRLETLDPKNPMQLPERLTDANGYVYTIVSQAEQVPDGTPGKVAIYEIVPPDEAFVYTPDESFCLGKTTVLVMRRLNR